MKRLAILILASALYAQPLVALELPKPPSGFAWQEIPELKAAFLRPDGWFFKQENSKGTMAYFITKEDISKGGEFSTGLTVNVFHFKKDSAVEHGQALIEKMAANNHVQSASHTVGPFQEFSCQLKNTDATGTIEMYALTVANPKTNTLYLFMFESPEHDWEASWKQGKAIIDSLAIDDEY